MKSTNNIFLSEEQFEEIFKSHIKIQTYPKSIESIFFNKRKLGRIDYKPYYQRNYVWDDSKATYFVESILLGTEIPPLIFFKGDKETEVIDGRQRFETLKRFIEGEFKLTKKGLVSLLDFSKKDFDVIRQESPEIYQTFLDAKIRIIEFELINQPPSNPILIDRLKKEIFGRYNSGITPLRKAEIDNAIYDSDSVSRYFKKKFRENPRHRQIISDLFLRQSKNTSSQNIESILQFIRKSLVLFKFPIKYYAGGAARSELISKFYEYTYNDHDQPEHVYEGFLEKVELINSINERIQPEISYSNRLFLEGLLWASHLLEQEEVDFRQLGEDKFVRSLTKLFLDNASAFELTDSHYRKETLNRFSIFENYIKDCFGLTVSQYVQGDNESREEVAQIRAKKNDTSTELEKLQTLRITKPDPSRNSVEDIHRSMSKNRFLIRPSYQRSEVIDQTKASAIIESILLGIMLPAIFIFKRRDGISEIIDGQQRLLTILGFMGEKYLDENNNFSYSKNNSFKLKNLKILKNLNGKNFDQLSEDMKEKIWDFELLVVEIEEILNPSFNPVDLFIRLNDKPYPIRENSFEMWNSWVDKDVIDSIKAIFRKNQNWFFIKNVNKDMFRDRMTNEELFSILTYFDYRKSQKKSISSFLDIYQKGERINARIKEKKEVTSLLFDVTGNNETKTDFLKSISNIEFFLKKTEALLNSKHDDPSVLRDKLDHLLSSGSKRKYHQRTLQDFYILWSILDEMDIDSIKEPPVYEQIASVFNFMKNVPETMISENKGYLYFANLIKSIKPDGFEGLFLSD
ncbi:MAG: DUF262 domain-containing protein [Anaerolineaceae bacterium]|nr:DUF262 domain-containing protein [Anaerolineaceae bacterium]